MNNGWIKLHRNIVDWEWFDDHNALKLLIYLNAKVNYEDKKWKGIIIKAGSIVIGHKLFSERVKMSMQQFRTALDKLIECGEVTKEATNHFTVLTLVKWEKMQKETKQDNKPITNQQQTNNKPITTTKEDKEIKERKETIYYANEIEFLNDWAKVRQHFDGVQTLFKKLNTYEGINFNKLKDTYTRKDFQDAMQGMFQQKGMYKTTRVRPSHFLEEGNLEKYQDCKINKIKLFNDRED